MIELRNVEQELDRFRARLFAAAAFVLFGFVLLGARLAWLQIWKHEELSTQAEANRIAVVADRAQPRLDPRSQRRRAGQQLLRLHAGDHAVQDEGRCRRGHRPAGASGRHPAARPQPLQAADRREQELRIAADPHQAQRRGSRPLRGAALPLPRRRGSRAAVSALPAGRDRFPPDRLHRAHQSGREGGDGGLGRRSAGQLPRHRIHRQARTGAEVRSRPARRCGLRGSRNQRRRPRGAAARQPRRDAGQHAAACRSTSSCRRWSRRCSANAWARWWRSIRATARCWPSSASPPSTPTCSSMASMPTTGASSTNRSTSRC